MKTFVIPKVEVVHFERMSIFTTSCDPCPGCPPGSDSCPCVDQYTSDYSSSKPASVPDI